MSGNRLLRRVAVTALLGGLIQLGCGWNWEAGERYLCLYAKSMLIECKPESEFSTEPPAGLGQAIYEVDRFHNAEPTAEQRRAADELARRCFEVAEKRNWYDFDTAMADGYQKLFRDRLHYANEEFIMDDRVLDPERPEYLMFLKIPGGGTELTGFMFVVSSPLAAGQQIGGTLTRWHYHRWRDPYCLNEGMMIVGAPGPNGCRTGQPGKRSVEMLHVWLVDHPDGRFASEMQLKRSVMTHLLEQRAAAKSALAAPM